MPKTERLVDLAAIRRAGPGYTMTLAVIPQPRLAYNYLSVPGRYRFRLTVAAENAKPVSQRFVLKFAGAWDPEEEAMAKAVELGVEVG